MPQTKFRLNPTYHSGADLVWRFQDGHCGSHLGYQNEMILAILNLYVAPMPPIKFQLNPTYGLRGDVIWRFSRWPTWWPFWISEWNDFNNCMWPQCHPPRLGSIWLRIPEQMWFQDFQDGRLGETILAILSLYVTPMPPIKFWLNPTPFGRRCRLKNFYGSHDGHLGYQNGTILAILIGLDKMLPSKFGVNWPFGSVEEAKNRFSRWRPWRPSWISDRHDFSYFLSTSHPDAS